MSLSNAYDALNIKKTFKKKFILHTSTSQGFTNLINEVQEQDKLDGFHPINFAQTAQVQYNG